MNADSPGEVEKLSGESLELQDGSDRPETATLLGFSTSPGDVPVTERVRAW